MNWKQSAVLVIAVITYAFIVSLVAKPVSGLISDDSHWILNLIFIIFTYFFVLLPFFVIGKNERIASVFGFVPEREIEYAEVKKNEDGSAKTDQTRKVKYLKLLLCFIGLQVSYLTWGILQEKVMTQDYVKPDGTVEKFTDSQFVVFVNRVLAFIVSRSFLIIRGKLSDNTPAYKYSLCSVSNTLSSWFQYEALKFISFPVQVVAKSCKVIPVMLVHSVVSKKGYSKADYVLAVTISLGMLAFLSGIPGKGGDSVTSTTISGAILLIAYLGADSFTSSWQSRLFTVYKQSEIQMMFGVNMMSVILTSAALYFSDGFTYSFFFMQRHPNFIFDCVMTALCSTTGQLAIFYTIAEFGPMIFALLMTLRQGLSVLLSCIVYHHKIEPIGIVGCLIIFGSLIYKGFSSGKKAKPIVKPTNDEPV